MPATIVIPGAATSGSALVGITYCTESDMVAEVRALLEDEPFEDVLQANLGASATTFDLAEATGNDNTNWGEGNTGEFDDSSYEQFKITTDPTSTTVTVRRGHNGTTAATHTGGTV